MSKLVSIVGPTATGKTSLALFLANKLIKKKLVKSVDIISVDSRQVYQGLEIISGADVPKNFEISSKLTRNKKPILPEQNLKSYSYYTNPTNTIRLHGVSIIKPNQEWSVSHFQEFALTLINQSWQKKYLPILVGGTGLYHQHLFNPDTYLKIKPDSKIRQKAEQMTLKELQNWLHNISADDFNQLNQSDKNNPRRLIRKIELLQNQSPFGQKSKSRLPITQIKKPNQNLTIGLSNSLEKIKDKIEQRVRQRFEKGGVKEVKKLMTTYKNLTSPALSATGVREIWQFLNNQISKEKCQQLWTLREYQYAKRQITWWKKNRNITWFDINETDYQKQASDLTKKLLNS